MFSFVVTQPNFIMTVDGYKINHFAEMPLNPDGTFKSIFVQSAVVARKVPYYSHDGKIVAMGQTLIARTLAGVRITEYDIFEAEQHAWAQGYEFNRAGWEIIVNEYDGRIPLRVEGVPEGTLVDIQTPIISFINTDDRLGWLPSYVENWAQNIIWKMSLDATLARQARYIFRNIMLETGSNMSMLNYKVHNFGDRGAGSPDEAAIMSGISHAALFDGSDCFRANKYIKAVYAYEDVAAYTTSIEAFEHTTTMLASDIATKDDWGAAIRAVERLEAAVARSKRGIGIPLISTPIDTYDSERYTREYIGTRLKDRIIASGGTFVARPDSGDILLEPGKIGRILAEQFGTTENAAGYKTLHPSVAVIQGDGVNITTIEAIIRAYIKESGGLSLDGFVVGMGGGMTNWTKRDDASFSQKATAYSYDGENWLPLLKDPKTDSKKKSLSGLLYINHDGVVKSGTTTEEANDSVFSLVNANDYWVSLYRLQQWHDTIVPTTHIDTFSAVRARARTGLE